jgi:hypothetical protein
LYSDPGDIGAAAISLSSLAYDILDIKGDARSIGRSRRSDRALPYILVHELGTLRDAVLGAGVSYDLGRYM